MLNLTDDFLAAIHGKSDWNQPLRGLLHESEARAVGAWEVRGERLLLVGFVAVDDMAPAVALGFAQATGDVSFQQTQFGIVQTVTFDRPIFATHDNRSGTLPGSASWIVRFGAVASLAIPIHHGGLPRLAIAMSTPMELSADRHPASFLLDLVAQVEQAWNRHEPGTK